LAEVVDARERRTRQFEHYLGLMEFRARRLVKADCFVIFSRRVPPRLHGAVSAQERFVQFAFHTDDFYLDLPDSTLTHVEANRAVAERPGFQFFLGKAPGSRLTTSGRSTRSRGRTSTPRSGRRRRTRPTCSSICGRSRWTPGSRCRLGRSRAAGSGSASLRWGKW
jgi:hypothetical protein